MAPMLSSIANALSSRRRRFLRMAVWGVDEWAWGIKMNPMLLELPPQTAWHRLRLSSTESAPHKHRREVLETQVFKPMQPRHAEATGCSRWPWLSTDLKNWSLNISTRKRWASQCCLFWNNLSMGQIDLSVGDTRVTFLHQFRHCPFPFLVSAAEVEQIKPSITTNKKHTLNLIEVNNHDPPVDWHGHETSLPTLASRPNLHRPRAAFGQR